MRYLVTGGAGFIGSNTVDELVRRGHNVIVLDDLSNGKESNLDGVKGKIEFIRGSITDGEIVQKVCRGVDYVIHLAARASVPRSVKDPLSSNQINVDGTLKVLLAARDAKVRRVVFSASSSAYGETPTLPKVESMPAAPISPYGVSKLTGELYLQVFGRCYGLENVSLRYFNVFGPRQDPGSPYSGVLARFCLAILDGAQPIVFGDGEQSRDFNFIENVVQVNLSLAAVTGLKTSRSATSMSLVPAKTPAHLTPACSHVFASLSWREHSPSCSATVSSRATSTSSKMSCRSICWLAKLRMLPDSSSTLEPVAASH